MSTCSKCGAVNRPNAKFCTRCGSSLAPASAASHSRPLYTTKVCPSCRAHNTLGERTCRQCGYTFTTMLPPTNKWIAGGRFPWLLLTVAVVVVAALLGIGQYMLRGAEAGMFAPSGSASSSAGSFTPSPLNNAIQATVQILTPDDNRSGRYSLGSGSVVDADGYILTNFHVVGSTESGALYNRRGDIWIGVTEDGSAQPPAVRYRAEVVAFDLDLDLALLRIIETQAGGDLPADLGLNVLPIGDSDSVQIGDPISVLGYPGLGGDTLTVTRGSVAGFLSGWIKTDAETNEGNSGGAAVNASGELIGVPTAGYSEAGDSENLPGKIGLLRPINLAQPLLEKIER